jgi:hypothetical protein
MLTAVLFYAYNESMSDYFHKDQLTINQLEEHRRLHWEHYRRLFATTKFCLYYINSRGYVEKYLKKNIQDVGPLSSFFERVPMKLYIRKKKNKQEEYLAVIINHRRYPVKKLVAMTFSRIWLPGSKIYHRNKNIMNCGFKNLLIVPPGTKFNHTHRGKRIQVLINKRWINFNSLKEAAEELNVSVSSFRRHIKGQIKIKNKGSMPKLKFKYVENTFK